MRVGLVSDTHGHLDPLLHTLFARCALILHAGDVVREAVLAALERIAPVTAIRGNNDEGTSLARLPETALVRLGDLTALVVHDLGPRERPKPPARGLIERERPAIVVHGHSHRPDVALVCGTLFVNPGSAGPRRFSLPRAAAILTVRGRTARVELFDLAGTRLAILGEPVEATL
ncbi:MAG TPA: metallophosphoesterase family protein [Anaeromyxobacter sp.]